MGGEDSLGGGGTHWGSAGKWGGVSRDVVSGTWEERGRRR